MTSAPSIELKRHHANLGVDETAKVVDAVAELIVAFLKKQHGPASAASKPPRLESEEGPSEYVPVEDQESPF